MASPALATQLFESWRDAQLVLGGAEAEMAPALDALDAVMGRAAAEQLTSANELLDDMSTSAMPVLLLPYWKAKLLEKGPSLLGVPPEDMAARRLEAVNAAKEIYSAFLYSAMDLDVLHGADLEAWEELEGVEEREARRELDANGKRMRKVERYRRQQAASVRIKEIDAQLRPLVPGFTSTADADASTELLCALATGSNSSLDAADELLRERWEVALNHAVRDALDQLGSLAEEQKILAFMAQRAGATAADLASSDARMRQAPPDTRPGLQVTHLDRGVDGQITERRQVVKAQIFRPYVELPTMSLEEFAQQEVADAVRRSEAAKAAEANPGPRRMDQLQRDGDEDDAELAEVAAAKDRAWDDWKDDHPRGMGNKAGKRF